jgi:uncharacterized membrane protein
MMKDHMILAVEPEEDEEEGIAISSRLFGMLVLGIVLVFVGIAVLAIASTMLGGQTSTGVVIFIGPIPIVFGSGPGSGWLILIGIILAVVSVLFFVMMNRRVGRFG